MKSNSKQTSASKIGALNVSFKSCLYFEFLLSLSANAHKMLSVEKNIAIRIDKIILRLFNISLSTQRIFKIPIENKTGTITFLYCLKVREKLCSGWCRHGMHFCKDQHTDGIFANGVNHLVEHLKAFNTVFHHRIVLTITA